jgi:ORF6N domain
MVSKVASVGHKSPTNRAALTIERRILVMRGQKVMIDADLAVLYGVPTKRLNEQVRRNIDRFPADFMFQLTPAEKSEVVANCDHLAKLKFSRVLPHAFTEHGAIQAANVLNSEEAVVMSVHVVRAFVRLRELISTHTELALKLKQLEKRLERRLDDHDHAIEDLMQAIRQLMTPPTTKKRSIGFVIPEDKLS